jgi:hypothetical protein
VIGNKLERSQTLVCGKELKKSQTLHVCGKELELSQTLQVCGKELENSQTTRLWKGTGEFTNTTSV